jgi:EF hand
MFRVKLLTVRQKLRTLNYWKPLLAFAGACILGLFAAGILPPAAIAQKSDKGVPKAQRALVLGEDDVKDLLLLMDIDKNGKISKQGFMSFMEAEFDKLDEDKSGELDPKELTHSQIRAYRPAIGK